MKANPTLWRKSLVKELLQIYLLQDASGSIWRVDLSFSLSMQKPSRVHRCHSDAVEVIYHYC